MDVLQAMNVFVKAGRVDYFCTLHPHMVGAIVVAD